MTKSEDYRMYIEKCFTTINENMGHIREDTKEIKNHLIELNGSVARHEEFKIRAEGIVREGKSDVEDICKRVTKVEKRQSEIDNSLLEYNFLKKYPKLAIIIIGVFVFIFLQSLWGTWKTIQRDKLIKDTQANTEITNQILEPERIERGIKIE